MANAKPYSDSTYTADALSRVASIVPEFVGTAATALTTFTYGFDTANRWGRTTVTDESGKQQRTATDLLGNAVETILGFGAAEATTTRLEYTVAGDRTRATDPRGLVTTYGVNTRGLPIAKTSPDAGTQQHAYDAAGQVRFSQDANQATSGTVAFTNYDFAGRPLVSGLGSATFGSLDPNTSSALETTTANWLAVSAYDVKPSSAGYPWSLFSTQLASVSLSNVTGRLAGTASKSHGAWQITLFSYDLDGQVTTRHTFTQNYMANAVLAALTTTTTYTRDLRDAVLTRVVTTGAGTFRHWYDYDARGLLSAAFASTGSTKPGTPDVTYTYRPTGQVATRQFAGGPVVPFGYTIREQLAAIGDVTGTTIPFSARYMYYPNGTVSQADFYNGGVSDIMIKRFRYFFPAYDALNRLQSADFGRWTGTGWSMTTAHDLPLIQYDKAGNITALQRNGPNGTLIDNLTYGYATGTNRLSMVTDAVAGSAATWDAETGGFTYDANGNLLTAPAPYGVTAAVYDHRNLPLLLTANGVMSAYRYDEQGQRISKRVTGSNLDEFYILDGRTSLGVVTVDGAGAVVSWTWNVLAGDKVVGRETQTAQRLYYHTDLLGTTRVVVQGATIVEAYDYDPWGVRLEGRILAGPTKEGFTTKERDAETGLDYFGARYYMAAVGRWTSVDPLVDSFPAWSGYNYVGNNPAGAADAFGLMGCDPPDDPKCKTATIFIRSFAPFRSFGGGFAGDSRTFSTDLNATSRISGQVTVNTTSGEVVSASAQSSTTRCTGIMCSIIFRNKVARENPTISVTGTNLRDGITVELSGANPFISIAPDIDVRLNLTMGKDGSFSGVLSGDAFPSAEVFVVSPQGTKMLLEFQARFGPLTGPVFGLPGKNDRSMGRF